MHPIVHLSVQEWPETKEEIKLHVHDTGTMWCTAQKDSYNPPAIILALVDFIDEILESRMVSKPEMTIEERISRLEQAAILTAKAGMKEALWKKGMSEEVKLLRKNLDTTIELGAESTKLTSIGLGDVIKRLDKLEKK